MVYSCKHKHVHVELTRGQTSSDDHCFVYAWSFLPFPECRPQISLDGLRICRGRMKPHVEVRLESARLVRDDVSRSLKREETKRSLSKTRSARGPRIILRTFTCQSHAKNGRRSFFAPSLFSPRFFLSFFLLTWLTRPQEILTHASM